LTTTPSLAVVALPIKVRRLAVIVTSSRGGLAAGSLEPSDEEEASAGEAAGGTAAVAEVRRDEGAG
jgi:hypothetical protein